MSKSKSMEEWDHEILFLSSFVLMVKEADLEGRSDMNRDFF